MSVLLHEVILVDEQDNPVGTMEKMEAHRLGRLHRAFSVFVFDAKGRLLLQQRAMSKYHSAGLWTNTCCSHPAPGETTGAAAGRRLQEEMGFNTPLQKVFDFVYRAAFSNGLTEHEFDHVLTGQYEGKIQPDPDEVMAYRYEPVPVIEKELLQNPEHFSAWFAAAFPRIKEWWEQYYH